MQCYVLRTELDGWLSQLNWPVTALLQYSNKSECLHFPALGTHSLEILAFTLLFYGLCLPANGLVCRIFQSRLPLSCNSKQRNINLNRKQRDERWETSQHFLCISSISIRFLLPHLSFAADHIQTSSTFDQCVNQSYL